MTVCCGVGGGAGVIGLATSSVMCHSLEVWYRMTADREAQGQGTDSGFLGYA